MSLRWACDGFWNLPNSFFVSLFTMMNWSFYFFFWKRAEGFVLFLRHILLEAFVFGLLDLFYLIFLIFKMSSHDFLTIFQAQGLLVDYLRLLLHLITFDFVICFISLDIFFIFAWLCFLGMLESNLFWQIKLSERHSHLFLTILSRHIHFHTDLSYSFSYYHQLAL